MGKQRTAGPQSASDTPHGRAQPYINQIRLTSHSRLSALTQKRCTFSSVFFHAINKNRHFTVSPHFVGIQGALENPSFYELFKLSHRFQTEFSVIPPPFPTHVHTHTHPPTHTSSYFCLCKDLHLERSSSRFAGDICV